MKEILVAEKQFSLGLDSSTQSLTAVIIDLDESSIIYQKSLDYALDQRLNGYGINRSEYIVPPREQGEADQPPLMYLASLDALFSDMKSDGVDLKSISVINDSGQQHGHVYLNPASDKLFSALNSSQAAEGDLVSLLGGCFSYGTAPIWKTSNTAAQAEELRIGAGGKEAMIRLSGSDSPLRFSGAVIRRVGRQFPDIYKSTKTIHLISSFIPGVLTGNTRVPTDWGNCCGTSLMDYQGKQWSPVLAASAAKDLPGGTDGLLRKLPEIVAPDTVVGQIARYFVDKYGLDPLCRVTAGSGDNPQTKVLVKGDLLSLGTSFVNMVSTDGTSYDFDGYANGMYDGLGRPFMFGCRTNGAMVWDGVRAMHGLGRNDFVAADSTLESTEAGKHVFLWQPDNESFPVSGAIDVTRIGYSEPDLALDYAGSIESALGIVYLYSRGFAASGSGPIAVTGGVTKV
ncbi:MAG: xylulose kinase, partial [Spirochaetales bacterium]|nr:xylulose kinase [Spirochaetales bacterium]